MKVSEVFVETLAEAGVKRVYGLSEIRSTASPIRSGGTKIDWLHVRHEEAAAFAAGAERT